ncbi:MAG: M20/M25/M40 family metallo-hydrolase [Candidatus Marinimicrobia bacterium]|nr:M20/M25/M40 family metallo-hydrolase [Candidatus Neomarinimicrobiota bacterium]
MKRLLITFIVLPALIISGEISDQYKANAERIIEAALNNDKGFERLAELCDTFGPRFTGSPNLENAIDWILEQMENDGLANVHGERVKVPRWVRGKESLELIKPFKKNMHILGLGGSIGTPKKGIRGDVFVVNSYDDLEKNAEKADGKIVLFNVPFTNYGETVGYRYGGASAAAKAGAIASLIRSVGPFSMNTPHTGGTAYVDTVKKIPYAAITLEDAAMFQRIQDRGGKITVKLKMDARFLPDSWSRNIVGELPGSEYPDEVIVLGGHIDSWDVGQGAMDDAGGCVAAWEAVRLIKELGLQPKRTIRVVMWTNEENGLRGGNAYRDSHQNELENHILAIESDGGVFSPEGFGFSGSDEARLMVKDIANLLKPIGSNFIGDSGGGADIGPIMKEGVPGMGLKVDGSKYFWYHHTHADAMDKLDKNEFNRCVATLAVMAYVVADMDERLPR